MCFAAEKCHLGVSLQDYLPSSSMQDSADFQKSVPEVAVLKLPTFNPHGSMVAMLTTPSTSLTNTTEMKQKTSTFSPHESPVASLVSWLAVKPTCTQ